MMPGGEPARYASNVSQFMSGFVLVITNAYNVFTFTVDCTGQFLNNVLKMLLNELYNRLR